MSRFTFKTRKDALAAGFTRGGAHRLIEHRGIECCSVDVSGGNSFGYDFAIFCLGVRLADHADMTYLDDLNVTGSPGCFGSLYEPGVADDCARRAVEMIDAYLAENPEDRPDHEQRAIAKLVGATAPMYDALCKACDAGHPGIRRSNRSGEPVFEDTTYGGQCRSSSAQLNLFDAERAAQQLASIGIAWEARS